MSITPQSPCSFNKRIVSLKSGRKKNGINNKNTIHPAKLNSQLKFGANEFPSISTICLSNIGLIFHGSVPKRGACFSFFVHEFLKLTYFLSLLPMESKWSVFSFPSDCYENFSSYLLHYLFRWIFYHWNHSKAWMFLRQISAFFIVLKCMCCLEFKAMT